MEMLQAYSVQVTRRWLVNVGCMMAVGWATLDAQSARPDTTASLRGPARAYFLASAYLDQRHVSASGFLMPSVSERWQLGLAPTYSFSPSGANYGHSNSLQLAAIANYVVGRAYRVVGYVDGYGATSQAWTYRLSRTQSSIV